MVRTAPNQLANAAWTDGRVTWQIDQFCAFSLDPYSKWNTLGWWFPLGIRIIVPLWGPVILLRLWPSKYIVRICTVCVLYMYIYIYIHISYYINHCTQKVNVWRNSSISLHPRRAPGSTVFYPTTIECQMRTPTVDHGGAQQVEPMQTCMNKRFYPCSLRAGTTIKILFGLLNA